MLVVVLNMPEHSSFQYMLFPMLCISKYAKSYASIMDISLLIGVHYRGSRRGGFPCVMETVLRGENGMCG